ncbi:histidine phosphatase superfamily [Mrakia frigida]|uniref:phosphoglycerate mutase family protein n=1 Tax=Mrakia frigida TaxID=29902 RepID=UPI003FCC117A
MIVPSAALLLTSLASLVAASPALSSRNNGKNTEVFAPSNYSVVDGFFIQSSPTFNATGYDALKDNFGLIDKSPNKWKNFAKAIKKLNDESDELTAYKVIYIARHGEGYHNYAQTFYGTPAWICKWSLLNGDGNMTWGPDATLTPNGIAQAQAVNAAWKIEAKADAPLPQVFYSSPMRRAASTLEITWRDILLQKKSYTPTIKEHYRESIGLHTCDQRSTKTVLSETYPGWNFDASFTEHDQLYNPTYQENGGAQSLRLQQQMNELFSSDDSTYVSITAHSGVINSFFTAVGHKRFSVQTGGVVPVVIKAVGHKSATNTPIVAGLSATAPACV